MKIATWNVERLKHYADNNKLLAECEKCAADILVLTETDERLKPHYPYCYSTPLLRDLRPDYYHATENRVSIYSNYKCIKEYPTYDRFTSKCVELETEKGNLLVYGTIIGIYGNREKTFQSELVKQLEDIKKLCAAGHNLCFVGDYNLSFGDNYYFTKFGRETIQYSFAENNIRLLTSGVQECIDHIAISKSFCTGTEIQIEEWNQDKKLSDHKGISVEVL